MINIRKLESELWESADLLRAGSIQSVLYACVGVDFSALCLQPVSTGRGRNYKKPAHAEWTGYAGNSQRLHRAQRSFSA